MKLKIFKPGVVLLIMVLLLINLRGIAQTIGNGSRQIIGNGRQVKNNFDDANAQIKNYSKSYAVDANDILTIKNRYGKVTVITWNKNEIRADVEIKIITASVDDSKKMLDNITINDRKEGSAITFETAVHNVSTWGSWTGEINANHKLEINYIIYMPAKNELNITNNFGPTVLPDFDGKVMINSAYGSFSAKSLTNNANKINVSYGGANIESLKTAEVEVNYGSLTIGAADNVTAHVKYGSAFISKIITSGNIEIKGGELEIAEIGKNIQNLNINSSMGEVQLGLNKDENADINVTVKFGRFNYGSHSVSLSDKPVTNGRKSWSPTQNYTGHLGKGDAKKVINITAEYGSIKFN